MTLDECCGTAHPNSHTMIKVSGLKLKDHFGERFDCIATSEKAAAGVVVVQDREGVEIGTIDKSKFSWVASA